MTSDEYAEALLRAGGVPGSVEVDTEPSATAVADFLVGFIDIGLPSHRGDDLPHDRGRGRALLGIEMATASPVEVTCPMSREIALGKCSRNREAARGEWLTMQW